MPVDTNNNLKLKTMFYTKFFFMYTNISVTLTHPALLGSI